MSACISPSTISDGSRWRNSCTARDTFSASACRTEPKFENDNIAIRGSIPKFRVTRLAAYPICASCSAVGSMVTVVSAQNTTCFSNTSMYMPLTSPDFGCAPMTSSAGRMVSG